jgi:GntR family transcriptional regulator
MSQVSILSILTDRYSRPFAIRNSPFAIRHSPFAIRHSPFAIRHSPFAIRNNPQSMNTPLYRTVYDSLKARILAGDYPPDVALPSESRLVHDYGVSLITVRRALHELVLDGLIERRQGVGSFVREASRGVVVGLSSFDADVAEGRLSLARDLLADRELPAPADVADRLRINAGSTVRYLARLDRQGAAPFSVDEVYIPLSLTRTVTPELAASPLFFPLWCESAGVEVGRVDFELGVQMPDGLRQEQLGIGPDTPLLICGELNFDAADSPVMWIVSYYRGDVTHLTHSVRIGPDVRRNS